MSMKRRASNTSLQVAESDSDEEAFLYDDDPFSSKKNTTVSNDPQLIVEKFMGRKLLKMEDDKLEEMFLVKWKGLSYLHASWERKDDLDQVDPNAKLKLKRFLQTPQAPGILGELSNKDETKDDEEEEVESNPVDEDEIQYFSPDMIEVQRIISCDTPTVFHAKARKPGDLLKAKGSSSSRKRKTASLDSSDEEEDTAKDVKYLVKWTGLSYDECSWERWEDIKPFYREVWLFWQIQKPPKLPIVIPAFPSLQEYRKLEKSPAFGISNILIDEDDNQISNGLRLRDYQLEGVNWLLWNWWHKRPCILADEMGLGKTIQTVAFLHQLRYMKTTNINGPFLIIAPLSLVDQWLSEIQTWSPDMNTLLLHGNAEARETIIQNEFFYTEPFVTKQDCQQLKKSNICKFHILLTTFEVAVKEVRILMKIPWQVMIIDEAHKLKNTASRLFTTLSTIQCAHCVLLTGTPLQNKTEELWALLNFADPKRFYDMNDFLIKFGDLKNASQVAKLHDMLKPYLLRRIKEDVEKSLPPKEETIVEVALTSVQKRFYRAIFEKNTQFLFRGLKASNQPSLMNVMMELRKCCNHPFLVRGVEERVFMDLTAEERLDDQIMHKKLIDCAGKLVLLDKLLPRLFAEGHKVLIFSQMVKVLNLLEDFLKYKGYSFERLDGSTKSSDRKDAVERFCKPSMNKFIMLLSTKAGGLGLNLTAADTVIIYDSDWNPQNDLQAQARAHRIGQTKAVMVYRLLTRKTYEMEMFHQASMKLGLDRAVLAHARNEQEEKHHKHSNANNNGTNGGPIDNASKLNLKEIDELLKRGAYDVFREDDTEQNEFVEADIDAILQRRAHKVTYEDGNGSNSSTLGNFSKASFVSADEKEDVDINDPDFWKKAIGLKEGNGGLLHEPDELELLPSQRVRKQTKVYGDLHDIDEDQIKEFLKPLKADGTTNNNSTKTCDKDKDVSKETLLKEKRERDEARRQKALEEAKVKGDPKNWGSHGRDRVLRSLNTYGYGRWERIKTETGKVAMDTKDLEAFSRAYVLQCGLIASEMEPHKSDTTYVHEAIIAAKELESQVKSGKKVYDIPPSLSEEKFVAKLKTGLAKKTLNKLDTLSKLVNMIQETIEKAYQEKQLEYDCNLMDIDVAYTALTLQEIEDHLPLGDVRPAWARTCTWWNIDCDKHLLIGIFRHGFGRYDLIREDDSLLFKNKLAQLTLEAGGKPSIETGGEGSANAGEAVVAASTTTAATVIDNEGDENDGVNSDKEGDEMMMDDDGGTGGGTGGGISGKDTTKSSTNSQYGTCMPDPRHLNRLINFLVTSEMARMSKAEYAEKSKTEKKARNTNNNNTTEVFTIKKTAFLTNQHHMIDENGDEIMTITDGDGEIMTKNLFQALRDSLDTESIQLVYKGQIQGLKKCEQILSTTTTTAPPPVITTLSQEEENHEMEVIEGGENDEGGIKPLIIHELDAIRLSAAFILYGVPIEGIDILPVFENYKRYLGIKKPSNNATVTTTTEAYNWKHIKEYSKTQFTEKEIAYYYKTTWLPFCEQIYYRKALSYSQHKYLIPNPLLSPVDHHYASRGLCQLFAIRQQLLYTTYYVITQCTEGLLEYLRSPSGRNVDNMPVWWCPWIHDLGILLGMLKYGYLALEPIFKDEELPFTTNYLDIFVKKVFLFGENGILPVGRIDIASKEEAEAFLKVALLQYPEQRDIELRVIRILEELTRHLPNDHHCKLIVTTSLFRIFTMHNVTNNGNATNANNSNGGGVGGEGELAAVAMTGEAVAAGGTAGTGGENKPKIDLRTNRSTARIPAVSLKTFIALSRKRRKLYVASYHPEFFPDVE